MAGKGVSHEYNRWLHIQALYILLMVQASPLSVLEVPAGFPWTASPCFWPLYSIVPSISFTAMIPRSHFYNLIMAGSSQAENQQENWCQWWGGWRVLPDGWSVEILASSTSSLSNKGATSSKTVMHSPRKPSQHLTRSWVWVPLLNYGKFSYFQCTRPWLNTAWTF